jgi:hypothetical protein
VLAGEPSATETSGVRECLGCIPSDSSQIRLGAGFYYIRPHWNSNPAYARFATGGVGNRQEVQNFEYDYSFAPRVWASYVGKSGVGARARWWGFDQHDRQVAQGPGQILTAGPQGMTMVRAFGDDSPLYVDGNLNLQTIDMEITKDLKIGNLILLYSVSGHNLNGIGPTVSLEDRYPLFGGLSLICGLRGSILFGQKKQGSQIQSTLLDAEATQRQDSILPVGEIEVGGEYGVDLGPAHLFVQLTMVGQIWVGAGNNPASSAPSAATGLASADDSNNLGFFGLSASTGVRW